MSFAERVGAGLPHWGVGQRTGSTRRLIVVADGVPHRGQVDGVVTEHADGRRDVTVLARTVRTQYRFSDHGYNRADYEAAMRILQARFGSRVRAAATNKPPTPPRGLIIPGRNP